MLIVATHNTHKTNEIRSILGDQFSTIKDLTAFPALVPPEETGSTFAENSAIKALAASREQPDALILADDSGLEVDALQGAPGIYSARFAGENASDQENRLKLLEELSDIPTPRIARFRCVITIAQDEKVIATFDGTVDGQIGMEMTGESGFGYDPLFIPAGYDESFGILPGEVKHGMSHRGRALEQFRRWLRENPW